MDNTCKFFEIANEDNEDANDHKMTNKHNPMVSNVWRAKNHIIVETEQQKGKKTSFPSVFPNNERQLVTPAIWCEVMCRQRRKKTLLLRYKLTLGSTLSSHTRLPAKRFNWLDSTPPLDLTHWIELFFGSLGAIVRVDQHSVRQGNWWSSTRRIACQRFHLVICCWSGVF